MPNRTPVWVHLLPALIPAGILKGGVAVVIDVLRATTTMIHALAAGCDEIVPCLEIDEARREAASRPAGTSILAGERGGLPIEGFDIGNSPASCTAEVCSGKTMVMTTTNGTRAILACLEADRVFVAAFVNKSAIVEALQGLGLPIHIVCAGTDGQISLEDTLFAGALAHEFDALAFDDPRSEPSLHGRDGDLPSDTVLANDQAEIASSLWREIEGMIGEGYSLAGALGDGRGGRRVIALGLGSDIVDAADVDRHSIAAELLRDPIRIVASAGYSDPRPSHIES